MIRSIKKGTTFKMYLQEYITPTAPRDLFGYDLKVDIINEHDEIVNTLTVGNGIDITSRLEGKFILTCDTDNWVENSIYKFDVLFIKDGEYLTSDTFKIKVERAITCR